METSYKSKFNCKGTMIMKTSQFLVCLGLKLWSKRRVGKNGTEQGRTAPSPPSPPLVRLIFSLAFFLSFSHREA